MAGRLGRPRVGGWARGEGARWGGSGGGWLGQVGKGWPRWASGGSFPPPLLFYFPFYYIFFPFSYFLF